MEYLSPFQKGGRGRDILKKYGSKARTKTIRANSKFCICTPDVSVISGSPAPFILVDCNILLPVMMIMETVTKPPVKSFSL